MDQKIIGKFIAEQRKEKSYSQKQLAELLGISDKTISKWECGNGLPEVSLMLPLCEILKINVNELLSGKRLSEDNYQSKAEENLASLVKEKEYPKTYKMLMVWLVSFFAVALFFVYKMCVSDDLFWISKIMLSIILIMIDFLFLDIYRGEFVYWISYGPDYETAKAASSTQRKRYAWKYLRNFLIVSIVWGIYLCVCIPMQFVTKVDFFIYLILLFVGGISTIPIKFYEKNEKNKY